MLSHYTSLPVGKCTGFLIAASIEQKRAASEITEKLGRQFGTHGNEVSLDGSRKAAEPASGVAALRAPQHL